MALRKDLDGLRMQLPGNPAIYLMDAGKKRHIPNPTTYNDLFRDWTGIVQDPHLDEIDTGIPLTDGAILAQGQGDTAVYLIDLGKKRHIVSAATMDRYCFAWEKILHLPPGLLAAITTGDPIVWPERP